MKRIIAFLLVLALGCGLMAACTDDGANGGTAAAGDGLEAAKTYLFNLYKDESKETKMNYDLVGIVKITDKGDYNVTWTVDNKAITLTPNGKFVTVGIPEERPEAISYKLTATITDGKKELTVSFDRVAPATGLAASLKDGTYVIVTDNLTLSSLSEDKNYGYPSAHEVTIADGAVTGHYKADVLTITNVDGGITIQDAYGRYFYLSGDYNSPNVSAEVPADGGHIWKLSIKDDAYIIENASNGKTFAYSTEYSSWGCYPELTDAYKSALTIVAATAPAEDPVGEPSNDPAADSELSVEDAIALGASKSHNTYTEGKYYVTGVITEIYNEQYGNMRITDDNGNILTIYGSYSADGSVGFSDMETKPAVGDTVKLYGIIGQYSDTPQMKNAWIIEMTK